MGAHAPKDRTRASIGAVLWFLSVVLIGLVHLEVYIKEHSEADFTHGICPACMKKVAEEDKGKAK